MSHPTSAHDDHWHERQKLLREWSRHAEGGRPSGVREDVLESWERSSDLLPRTRHEAPLDDEDRTREQWASSPLRPAVRTLESELTSVARDGAFIVAVTGPDGKILWTHGSSWMRTRAEAVHFVPGGRWDEASMGTNALAMALDANRPAAVFSAEHFTEVVHEWVCYSAPIVDPATGAPLGVLDLSTTWDRAHPLALSTASALARNLGLLVPPDSGRDSLVDHGGVELRTLGTARVLRHGQVLKLPPRQMEILTVLSLFPAGLNLDALHAHLYEDLSVSASTCKAEVSHLRRALGGMIASRPYRIDGTVRADHLDVVRRLTDRDLAGAVEAYGGPMLPASEAPAIVEHRFYVERALRDAVLQAGDPDLLFALGSTMPLDDAVHEAAMHRLPDDDPRRAIARARLDTARR